MIPATTVGAVWASGAERAATDLAAVGVERYVSAGFRPGTVRHIVLLRLSPTVSLTEAEGVETRFLALLNDSRREGSRYIVSIESGHQLSTETAGDGFDLGFIVTFASEGDRNFYVGRPLVEERGSFDEAHDEFKAFAAPFLDTAGVVVFDLRP